MKFLLFAFLIYAINTRYCYSQNWLQRDSSIVVKLLQDAYGDQAELSKLPICAWKELKCTEVDGILRITLLRLADITGEISTEIGQLEELRELYLHRKRTNGQITSLSQEIWQLKKSEQFWLSWGGLNSIPDRIGKLTNLKLLVLNQFAVSISTIFPQVSGKDKKRLDIVG